MYGAKTKSDHETGHGLGKGIISLRLAKPLIAGGSNE
jgi:hypothetical protein